MQRYVKKSNSTTLFMKNCYIMCFSSQFASFRCPFLATLGFYLYFCIQKHTKQNGIMGLGSYWVRKDDQTGEAKTLKPWEEEVSNGDKFFPDPHKKEKGGEDSPAQEG